MKKILKNQICCCVLSFLSVAITYYLIQKNTSSVFSWWMMIIQFSLSMVIGNLIFSLFDDDYISNQIKDLSFKNIFDKGEM